MLIVFHKIIKKKNDSIVLKCFYDWFLQMVECNYETNETNDMYPTLNAIPLNDQQQFRLNKINEIKDYFVAEIKENN